MDICLIMAMDGNRGIGNSNTPSGLPWNIKEEMDFFKRVTSDKEYKTCLLFGYNTYKKIVEFKNKTTYDTLEQAPSLKLSNPNCYLFTDRPVAGHNCIKDVNELQQHDIVFVCGGKKLYEYMIDNNLYDNVIISKINYVYDCDCFIKKFEHKLDLIDSQEYKDFKTFIYRNENNG